jgi:hypothetical protein
MKDAAGKLPLLLNFALYVPDLHCLLHSQTQDQEEISRFDRLLENSADCCAKPPLILVAPRQAAVAAQRRRDRSSMRRRVQRSRSEGFIRMRRTGTRLVVLVVLAVACNTQSEK